MSAVIGNTLELAYDSLEDAFPGVDPGVEPFGERVLLQLRSPKRTTKGGLVLVPETRETEVWNTQVGRVLKIGPLAFRNRTTAEAWPEGMWAREGEFVRIPRWGGDRWQIAVPGREEPAFFVMFRDHELMGRVTMDPLQMRNHILD